MRSLVIAPLTVLLGLGALGCDGDGGGEDGGTDSATGEDTGTPADTGTPTDTGVADSNIDTGPDLRRALIETLGDSVWFARHTRDEGGTPTERAYQMHIDAPSAEWIELRNPYGPARQRVFRAMTINADLSIDTVVTIPSGWETPASRNGERGRYTFEVLETAPRTLRITDTDTSAVEEYEEGTFDPPSGGLTAEVRVFAEGGTIDDAFCEQGVLGTTSLIPTVWEFARGRGAATVIDADAVAGVDLGPWPSSGTFAVTDVEGMLRDGGTELTDSANFTVRWTGTFSHPGGSVWLREENDAVPQFLSAFWADTVGESAITDYLTHPNFFQVHRILRQDHEEEEYSFAAGDLPFEVITVRCAADLTDDTHLQYSLVSDTGPWSSFTVADTAPNLDAAIFPPVP